MEIDFKTAFLLICHSWQDLGKHQAGLVHPYTPKEMEALEKQTKLVQEATKAFIQTYNK